MNAQPETAAAPQQPEPKKDWLDPKDRDERGRFNFGNVGGPGNPFNRQVGMLRKGLLAIVTVQNMQNVALKLLTMAEEGNLAAIKLFLLYTLGKPQPMPDPDRLDIEEWNIFKETAEMKGQTATLGAAGTPESHLEHVRTLRPIVSEINRHQLFEAMDKKINEPEPPPAPPQAEITPEEQAKWDAGKEDPARSADALLAETAARQNPPRPAPMPAKNPSSTNGDSAPPQPRTYEEAYAAWEADRQARIRAYDKYLNFPDPERSANGVIEGGAPSANGKLPPQPPSNGRLHKK
jgi:hypothetical protein